MIEKSELLAILLNGENSWVEFKRDTIRPEVLAKEIVAFANTDGGRIFLGIEDDGTISGLQRAHVQDWVLNVFRDMVFPLIIPLYEEFVTDQEKRIGIITIAKGVNKPYIRKYNHREEAFVRMGNRCEIATREQMARLYASGGMLHVEVSPVSGTSFRDLDRARLTHYLSEILGEDISRYSDSDWIKRLCGLGFLVDNGFGEPVCTIVGLLSFCKAPRRFLPSAGLRFMSFASTQKAYDAQCDVRLDNALVADWQKDNTGSPYIAAKGIVEEFIQIAKPFISQESKSIDENMHKRTTYHYPWEALRETLLNAFIHRDWTINLEVTVENYSDRIEIISPGKMQNSMTIEKMLAGQRSPRNTLLVDVMKDYGYVDARGMGVRTKVVPLMKQINGRAPDYQVNDDQMKVILYRKR